MVDTALDYTIEGNDFQLAAITLQPGQTIIAEAGAMVYMEDGISFDVRMSDGSDPNQSVLSKLVTAGKRMVGGEPLFLTHFKNVSDTPRRVSFSAAVPGRIIPINLCELGCDLICQKDCFLTAELGVTHDVIFTKRLGFGMFGGSGFVLQKLSGQGTACISVGGHVIERQLNDEKIMVGTGCIAAFDSCIHYEIQRSGRLKSMIFGGEGLFLATLSGTGRVWLQSLPLSKLADHLSGMVDD